MTSILIPLFEGVELMDFTAPHEFFSLAPDLQLIVASRGGKPIDVHGLTFSNLADLDAVERCDVICIPGGVGVIGAIEDDGFMSSIRRLAGSARYLTSVCTGSLILGAAGLLTGRRAACHWSCRHILAEFGAIPDAGRVVRDGNVITGGGITAGADFALILIAEICGEDVAQRVQLTAEYAPAPPFNSGTPEEAPPHILAAVNDRLAGMVAEHHERLRNYVSRSRQGTAPLAR
ncbi:DJ-1/PfpI family protein [Singulisphaera sp. PoT]|uniref:DJ-1/PfpI family protein n=1 Tax=Singulisphaera sp. PoT TaxID=3411797 RepID=UPI003BF5D6F4